METCPYTAIELVTVNRVGHMVSVAKVNEALCKGCGACTAACLSGSIQQRSLWMSRYFHKLLYWGHVMKEQFEPNVVAFYATGALMPELTLREPAGYNTNQTLISSELCAAEE